MFHPNRFPRLLGLSLVMVIGLVCSSGCKENPGEWAPDKIATQVASSLEITGLSLTSTATGLEGSGKRADGETISVVVRRDSANKKISWEAKGDRGFVETGSYGFTN